MNKTKTKIELISWRDVAGNKYSRNLHPAMFYPNKYRKQMSICKLGTKQKQVFKIEYDKDYGITWLTRKVCDPLRLLGVDAIIELIKEAYEF